jgi:hypothetical protein
MRNSKGQFIKGANLGVKKSEEQIEKMIKNHKGRSGKKHSEETKKKISQSNLGRKTHNKGVPQTEEVKIKISNTLKGRIITKEHREKLSISAKGKVFTEEHKKNISLNHHNVSLEKNPKWKGGKSFEPYPLKWTNELREKIRSRDNYRCVICSFEQVNKKLCVHHIDEDKNNCDEKNLISLCLKCHVKIHNNQEFKKQNLWIAQQ